MPAHLARPGDITTFLREMRRAARLGAEQLQQITRQRDAAGQRLKGLRPDSEPGSGPLVQRLVEEMEVRDEELRATAAELGQQLEALRQSSVLLERERAKYVDLFEHAPDPYIMTNLAGVIEEANLAAGALFRAEVDFLRGRPLVTFVARGDTDAFHSLLRRLQTLDQGPTRSDPLRMALRMRPRGQPVFVAFIHVGILSDASGRVLALRWVLRRLNVEAEQAEAGQALADFAGSLAEDLRAPLVPIIEWARCLREWDVREEEERRQALAWIERSAHAQQAKLDELAEFAREHREGSPAQVTDVVDIAERAARTEGEWSRVLLRCDVGPGTLRVLASGLSRALDLFLQRALEGTPRTTNVELSIRAHGGEALIDIVASEDARIAEGWAVRTATAVRIVERCGGRVTLAGGSPTVRLRLPRLPA